MTKTITNPASEDWQDPFKKASRQKVADTISTILKGNRFPKNIDCLSLPAHKWFFESILASQNINKYFNFLALEKNEDVLENQVGEATKLNTKIKNARFIPYSKVIPYDIDSYLRIHRKLDFDIIYLDFMGNWSREKEIWLEDIITTNISKQYILAFTTAVIRTHTNNQESLANYAAKISKELYKSRNNLGRRSEHSRARDLYFYGVNGYIYKLAKKYNKEVKIHTPIEYINKSGHLQIVFLYHIIN